MRHLDDQQPAAPRQLVGWRVPPLIVLADARTILWSYGGLEEAGRWVTPSEDILAAFLALRGQRQDESPEAYAKRYLRFARKWGVLRLVSGGNPTTHDIATRRWPQRSRQEIDERDWPIGWTKALVDAGYAYRVISSGHSWFEDDEGRVFSKRDIYAEDIDDWFAWSEIANAIITIGDRLNRGIADNDDLGPQWLLLSYLHAAWDDDEIDESVIPGSEYWRPSRTRVYYEAEGEDGEEQPALIRADDPARIRKERELTDAEYVQRCKTYLALVVQAWFNRGDFTPVFAWGAERPQIRIGGNDLFAALGMRLALILAGARDIAFCDWCSNAFPADRKPRTDRNTFCPTCQAEGVPQRLAQRMRRRRDRERKES